MEPLTKHLLAENRWLRAQVSQLNQQIAEMSKGLVTTLVGQPAQPEPTAEPDEPVFPSHEYDPTVEPSHLWPRSAEWQLGPDPAKRATPDTGPPPNGGTV